MIYSLTHNFGDIERFYEMSYSKPTDNGMLQIFSFLMKNYTKIELFKTVPTHFMAVYLFLKKYCSIIIQIIKTTFDK